MSDETIKINRQMLRQALASARDYPATMHYPAAIEHALFGPKPPREIELFVDSDGKPFPNQTPYLQNREGARKKRFREVLE